MNKLKHFSVNLTNHNIKNIVIINLLRFIVIKKTCVTYMHIYFRIQDVYSN